MATLDIEHFICGEDNFAVLLHDRASGATMAIDAPEAGPIEQRLAARNWQLSHILVTHRHDDHVAGIGALKERHGAIVIAPAAEGDAVPHRDRAVEEGDPLEFAGRRIGIIATPGHTEGHVSYFFPDEALVFVGDTLFSLGCGRVMPGWHDRMWTSLEKLAALPDDTALYCGHEYTVSNARFALAVDPDNAALKAAAEEARSKIEAGGMTLPSTIGREKAANPFLRASDPALAARLGMAGAAANAVFTELRNRKDRF